MVTTKKEKLYDVWARRNPQFEVRYDELLRQYCDYGKGTNDLSQSRAKILGAGYEMYIMAFFIGLYSSKRKKLNDDPIKRKVLGQPIQYWGNIETRKMRKSYPQLKEFIYIALITKSDIDFISLDKGDLKVEKVASIMIETMEEYANYGFDYIQEQLEDNANWLYGQSSLLNTFLSFVKREEDTEENDNDDIPESLD